VADLPLPAFPPAMQEGSGLIPRFPGHPPRGWAWSSCGPQPPGPFGRSIFRTGRAARHLTGSRGQHLAKISEHAARGHRRGGRDDGPARRGK